MSRMFILYLLSLVLRSLLLAGFAGAAMAATKKVQVRHAAWTVVLFCLLLMPIADALLPAMLVPASVPEIVRPIQTFIVDAPASTAPQVSTSNIKTGESSADWWTIAATVVTVVGIAMMIRLTLVLRAVGRLRRGGRTIPNPAPEGLDGILVLESGSITVPLTVGFRKPALILPVDWRRWDDWKLQTVLRHERTHVQRRDWAIAVVAAFVKCLYWFNPLAWWLERRLSLLAEQASDEACVRFSGDPPRYAETLLEFASTTKYGHRWIGGVPMAQHKISLRIERVLALRRAGSGILPRAGWIGLVLIALPALYVAAAAEAEQLPAPITVKMSEVIRPIILSPVPLAVAGQQPPQAPPSPQGDRQPQPAGNPVGPPAPVNPPNPPQQGVPTNPDLVGEIRLILAPVDIQDGGQSRIEIQTAGGTNRWTGTAVWNIRNSGFSPSWWGWNANAFGFRLAGLSGRQVLFEDRGGTTLSYGCPDCSFLVWETGVGSPSASQAPGILFRLSADGRSLSATCQATECWLGKVTGLSASTAVGGASIGGSSTGGSITPFSSQTMTFTITSASGSSGAAGLSRTCFNVFGSVKTDGTPFTDADCASDPAPTTMFFFAAK